MTSRDGHRDGANCIALANSTGPWLIVLARAASYQPLLNDDERSKLRASTPAADPSLSLSLSLFLFLSTNFLCFSFFVVGSMDFPITRRFHVDGERNQSRTSIIRDFTIFASTWYENCYYKSDTRCKGSCVNIFSPLVCVSVTRAFRIRRYVCQQSECTVLRIIHMYSTPECKDPRPTRQWGTESIRKSIFHLRQVGIQPNLFNAARNEWKVRWKRIPAYITSIHAEIQNHVEISYLK